jgi:hypothetical protein
MNTQPIEARCDHCKQQRPLFLYEPDHGMHLGPNVFTCRWCTREKQPLLCVRCWEREKELEENDPTLNEEAETLEQICATNRRVEERRQKVRDECDGIAEATRRAEAGA